MTTKKKALAAEIWETLSAINVNEHTEKKGRFTYLSWSWAWATMMDCFPQTDYVVTDQPYSDGTVMVMCDMTVRKGSELVSRNMWLPVMDNNNNAIKNPTTSHISDNRMRCLVKCLAMFGLGHYVFAGEDLPEADSKAVAAKVVASSDKLEQAHEIISKCYEEHGRTIFSFVSEDACKAQDENLVIEAANRLAKVSANEWKTAAQQS